MASSINASTTAGVVTTADTSGVLNIQTAGTTALTVDTTTNVGIGTTSPSQRLHLNIGSATAIYSRIQNSAGDCYLGLDTSGNTNLSADNAGNQLIFKTQATERARFNATGALVLAGGTTTANGIGITFPATQSASSNANTLDDYEEGTFSTSMNLKFGGANVGMVYGDRKAQYVKIGKMVLVNLYIYLTTKGSSTGQASIEGFPFGTNTLVDFFIPLGVRGNLNSGGNQVSLYSSSAGSTTFTMYQCNLTGGSNAGLYDTAFNNNTELNFNFWYYTDS